MSPDVDAWILRQLEAAPTPTPEDLLRTWALLTAQDSSPRGKR